MASRSRNAPEPEGVGESAPAGKAGAGRTGRSSRDSAPPTQTGPTSSLGKVDVSAASVEEELDSLARARSYEGRYEGERVLAKGGMGEVKLCRDTAIGRDVAMKVLRPELKGESSELARLLREARVQGQLEHPAVPPVYDLGVSPDGAPYFTMKRLRGTTLAKIFKSLREAPRAQLLSARRKLLTEFVKICLGIDYAHNQGVVHRDLKPANLILGDFGEVYVLDWGIAQVGPSQGDVAPSSEGAASDGEEEAKDHVLGTPGYVAPEQLAGTSEPRSDVYSLGAILFELLTLVPLHTAKDRDELLASVRRGASARASERAPEAEVPPELEDVCVRATAQEPAARYASVREMVTAIERYLDGDRDLERRRELATQHAERAEAAARQQADDDASTRSSALREASRALALDPDNARALGTLAMVLLRPPAQTPPEVEASLDLSVRKMSRFEAKIIGVLYVGWLIVTAHWLAMDVKSMALVVAAIGFVGATAVSLLVYARLRNPGPLAYGISVTLNSFALGAASLNTGPFLLVPGTAAATTFAYVLLARGRVRWSLAAAAMGTAGVLVPYALQVAGFIPPTMTFDGEVLEVQSQILHFDPAATQRHFIFGSVGIIVATALGMLMIRRAHIDAERKLHTITWQLRQLVPEEARGAIDPASDRAKKARAAAQGEDGSRR